MSFQLKLLLATGLAGLLAACATTSSTGLPEGLSLGASADNEMCQATRRIDISVGGGGARYDVFCGTWRRPAATIDVYPAESAGETARLLEGCAATGEFGGEVLSCPGKTSDSLFRDVGVRAEGADRVAAARGLPALLPALRRGVAALSGLDAPVELDADEIANLPGVVALQDQEVLRRRGHKRNASFRFALAAEDFAKAAAIQDGLFGGDPVRRADIALDLALNLSGQGRFAEAEKLIDDAASGVGAQSAAWLRDKVVNYRAVHLLNKGDLRGALALAEEPFSEETASEGATFVADAASGAITVITPRDAEFVNQRGKGETPPLYSDSELRPGLRATILRAHRAYVRAILLDLLQRDGATDALDEAEALARTAPPGSAPWLEVLIGEKRALIALEAGDASSAVSRLSGLLAAWRADDPRSLLTAQLLTSLGRAKAEAGDRAGALAAYQEAFDLYGSVQGSFGVSPDRAGEYLDLLVDVADGGANAEATARYVDAFESIVEPRAAAAMALAAARLSSSSAAEEIRALQDAELKLTEARTALEEAAGGADPAQLAELTAAVEAAEQTALEAEDAARRAQPQYMQLVNRSAAIDDLTAALRPNEAFVAFIATRSGGFGYAVFDGKLTPFRTDLTSEKADPQVRRVRLTLRNRRGGPVPFSVAQAHVLFDGVLGPVYEDLKAAGIDTLVFSPRGSVGSVPPGVLVTGLADGDDGGMRDRDYRDIAWLARDFGFIGAPSAASFVAARGTERELAKGGLTVFGPPAPPSGDADWISAFTQRMVAEGRPARCGQLFETQPNIKAPLTPLAPGVARSFNRRTVAGNAFTDRDLLASDRVSNQQVLVFVTHGFFGDGFCITEPALLTSLDKAGGDGLLSASEILDLSLSADLVVLAACDTARAAEGAQGLAARFNAAQLDGLVRSFIYAGARAVLATHWVADDAAADAIVRQFFANARGTEMHQALKAAQEAVMARKQTAHPYFWGPYVVIGDAAHKLDAR